MNSIEKLVQDAEVKLNAAQTSVEIKELEIKYLGKNGLLTIKMKDLGQLPSSEKPIFGKKINEAKIFLSTVIETKLNTLKSQELNQRLELEYIDVTMPGIMPMYGNMHILEQTFRKIKNVFTGLGFEYHESPELDKFHYNFDVLNYPPDHPAMDELDTFYITDELLLRTQGTTIQGHVFENQKPPLRSFTISRCFRNDALDRTHSHTFHQVDAFMVDKNISMAHLKGTLALFARAMFGEDVRVRFRPDFFPFVEPGVDYAISSSKFANGAWLELGGAGMIHPNILENYGIDTEVYTGWAFGLGIERIPMLAEGVQDLRNFLENDLRFLEQFQS